MRAQAARKLERSQAAWRDDGARHVEASRDRQEQETAMWLKAIGDEAIQVEAEQIARSYGVRLADDDSTKVRMVIRSKAEDVVDEREEERSKRFLPPIRRTRKTKRAPECRLSRAPSSSGTDPIPEENGKTASISRPAPGVWQRRADGAVNVGALSWASDSAAEDRTQRCNPCSAKDST